MKQKRKILVPSYLRAFSCIGSACEDTCCSGWRVDIDKSTYFKYNKVKDSEMKQLFSTHIKRNRTNPTEKTYAKIDVQAHAGCPMLNEEKLCKVQLQLGEDYLSNICMSYPRVSNIVNNVVERSATMSCPEAARLALLNPNKMEFDEIEEPLHTKHAMQGFINSNSISNKFAAYFWDLRIFSIRLMQNRNYELSDRLMILGIFFQNIQDLILDNKEADIPLIINHYDTLIDQGSLNEILQTVPVEWTPQILLIKSLIDLRVTLGISNPRYLECHHALINGIGFTEETTIEDLTIRYQNAFSNYYQPFMNTHHYILENYLVNHIFKNLFPLGNGMECMTDYIKLIVQYGIIKMYLVGMAAYYKESFNLEHVILCIQSIAKTIEHNDSFSKLALEVLKANDFHSLAGMAILVKN
ncbi:flagellin lysine-N-methylase [Brevibacillus brevis]|uniref:flagellin lysine-N-methylase n=1 Tax=Brevibacillus brevis TaxID=1393 RepID=UPI0025A68104|nr:flagellin lysine-N-methylase [Brevibacillus brevis]WJQ81123.1 flagellin lysine-N-methylase [Brevibacillus brevis]